MAVPALRIRSANPCGIRAKGNYVLYWMIAARRTTWSYALDHAIAQARALEVPLLVLEPLRVAYPWACDRFHAFVVHGMADNQRAFAAAGVTYHPYVEPAPGNGRGLLEALAAKARLVITDEWPGFFQPRMVAAAAEKLDVRVDVVDSCGVLPLRFVDRAYPTAASFRRQVQRHVLPHLLAPPSARPLAKLPKILRGAELPARVAKTWPAASAALLAGTAEALAGLPIDHAIAPISDRGGAVAGGATGSMLMRGSAKHTRQQIGRASCRERVSVLV